VLPFERCWTDARFQHKKPGPAKRPDNIYEPGPWGIDQVQNDVHHKAHIKRDLSGRNVLVFDPAWRMKGGRRRCPKNSTSAFACPIAELTAFANSVMTNERPSLNGSTETSSCFL
jgi:hypothetical protein